MNEHRPNKQEGKLKAAWRYHTAGVGWRGCFEIISILLLLIMLIAFAIFGEEGFPVGFV